MASMWRLPPPEPMTLNPPRTPAMAAHWIPADQPNATTGACGGPTSRDRPDPGAALCPDCELIRLGETTPAPAIREGV